MSAKRPLCHAIFALLLALVATSCSLGPDVATPTPVGRGDMSFTPTPGGQVGGSAGAPTAPLAAGPTSALTPTPAATSTSTPAPTETPQPTIVTTPAPAPAIQMKTGDAAAKSAYDQALARWQSQGIEQYEIVVQYDSFSPWSGRWTLRVTGADVEVIGYAGPDGKPATPTVDVTGDTLKFLTVERLFASVEHRLTSGGLERLDAMTDYFVTFDPALGYPSSVAVKPKPDAKVTGQGSSTVVQSLTLLRRGTPAVPTATPAAQVAPTSTAQPAPSPSP